MKVLKFGGSSVQGAEEIRQVAEIILQSKQKGEKVAIVVSALKGVTDSLVSLGRTAALRDHSYEEEFVSLKKRHLELSQSLFKGKVLKGIEKKIEEEFRELGETLQGVLLVSELTPRTLDFILSFGERLSARILAEFIPGALYVDARSLIRTDDNYGSAIVNEKVTFENIQSYIAENPDTIPIFTGFIGSTEDGQTTTLGRGGSDFTASLVAVAVKAEVLEIWTDVDGVMTADPRKVEQAFPIPEMSYSEVMEMSHFGAKVVHPPMVIPALTHEIPIRIKNTFRPEGEGTFIVKSVEHDGCIIRGLSSIDNIDLLRVEGSGMVGVAGIATRLFGAIARKNISVIMISQCSSEHSICFAVQPGRSDEAKTAIEEEFSLEIQSNLIDTILIERHLSIIAVVGENMHRTPGVAGKLFSALGQNGVNVCAIAQGSSELNITCVVEQQEEAKALNVIHDAFFLSHYKTLHLFIVGVGLIGGTLLSLIQKQCQHLLEEYSLDIRVSGIADSKKMLFFPKGIPLNEWKQRLQASEKPMHAKVFVDSIKEINLSNSVFVDCTASGEVAECYADVLEANVSVVTPNKKANSGPYEKYTQLRKLARRLGVNFLYETNVGAGLPIISTIRDLLRSGDSILEIEGVLSGTLSYLFNNFDGKIPFSEVVAQAQKLGFTEPDPREDLNCMDVMRKLLILVRESGYELELDEIELHPFLPQECFEANSIAEFYKKLKDQDEQMA
nr:Bifunctional aspartokinase/homoserine dehydrogenase 1 [Chlamydiota bacterium]